jgi:hypothetical protein
MNKEKLYCYVDETGQDVASRLFVVVAVVSADEQGGLRQALTEIEEAAGTGRRKWHKSRPERRLCYLGLVLEKNVVPGGVFFGAYPKPLPYFFPFVEVIERAIKMMGRKHYTARILIDGIDRQKAREITNALRLRDVCLETVKGRRDESEPLIRLADMWAGCVRAAALGSREEEELLDRALRLQRVQCVTELPQKRKTP